MSRVPHIGLKKDLLVGAKGNTKATELTVSIILATKRIFYDCVAHELVLVMQNRSEAINWQNSRLVFNKEHIKFTNPHSKQAQKSNKTQRRMVKEFSDIPKNPTVDLLNVAPEVIGSDLLALLESEFQIKIIKIQRSKQASYANIDANRWQVEYLLNDRATEFQKITVIHWK